ncbi:MAG: hypothetical protein AB7O62_01585 [Pirellulales bacterium]
MESRSQTLHQQRAALGARQGDPESPASGTLFARRSRLESELALATSDDADALTPFDGGLNRAATVMVGRVRPTFLIRRDLRIVQQEIDSVQSQLDAIDRQLNKVKRKDRG